jgi:hypothetical protein
VVSQSGKRRQPYEKKKILGSEGKTAKFNCPEYSEAAFKAKLRTRALVSGTRKEDF